MKEVARAATPARTELEIAHFELVAWVARVARGSHLTYGENSRHDSLRRSFLSKRNRFPFSGAVKQ